MHDGSQGVMTEPRGRCASTNGGQDGQSRRRASLGTICGFYSRSLSDRSYCPPLLLQNCSMGHHMSFIIPSSLQLMIDSGIHHLSNDTMPLGQT